MKARKDREMQLTAELRPLFLAILGAFADARIARMAAAEATRSPRWLCWSPLTLWGAEKCI